MTEPASKHKVSKTRGVVVLALTRVLTMIVQLVAVRIYLSAIGENMNGAVLLVAGYSAYAALVDPGFIEGGIIHLLRSVSPKSDLNRWDVWRTHLTINLGIGVVGGLLLTAAGFMLTAVASRGTNLALFGLAGLWFAVTTVQTATMHYLTAAQEYSRLAKLSAVAVLVGHACSAILVWTTKQAPFYFVGLVIGSSISTYAMLRAAWQSERRAGTSGRFQPDLAREFVKIGKRSYANRALSLAAGNMDRILLGGAISPVMLTHYDNSTRLAAGLNELTGTIRQTFQADLAHAYLSGPNEFAAAADRFARLSMGIAITFILIPSAFADPLLRLWLGERAYAEGAFVMFGIALYRTFEMYYSCHGLTMTAAAQPQLMFPPILWNAACTVGLSVFAVKAMGIEGLAVLKVAINVLMFLPLLWFIKRRLLTALEMRRHLGSIVAMLIFGVLFGLLIMQICRIPLIVNHPILSLLMIPIASTLAALVIFAFKLAPCPDTLVRRVHRLSPRLAGALAPRGAK